MNSQTIATLSLMINAQARGAINELEDLEGKAKVVGVGITRALKASAEGGAAAWDKALNSITTRFARGVFNPSDFTKLDQLRIAYQRIGDEQAKVRLGLVGELSGLATNRMLPSLPNMQGLSLPGLSPEIQNAYSRLEKLQQKFESGADDLGPFIAKVQQLSNVFELLATKSLPMADIGLARTTDLMNRASLVQSSQPIPVSDIPLGPGRVQYDSHLEYMQQQQDAAIRKQQQADREDLRETARVRRVELPQPYQSTENPFQVENDELARKKQEKEDLRQQQLDRLRYRTEQQHEWYAPKRNPRKEMDEALELYEKQTRGANKTDIGIAGARFNRTKDEINKYVENQKIKATDLPILGSSDPVKHHEQLPHVIADEVAKKTQLELRAALTKISLPTLLSNNVGDANQISDAVAKSRADAIKNGKVGSDIASDSAAEAAGLYASLQNKGFHTGGAGKESQAGSRNMSYIMQNLAYGFEDAMISYQTGGVAGAARGATNNMTAIAGAAIANPYLGAAVIGGTALLGAFAPMLLSGKREEPVANDEFKKSFSKLMDSRQQQATFSSLIGRNNLGELTSKSEDLNVKTIESDAKMKAIVARGKAAEADIKHYSPHGVENDFDSFGYAMMYGAAGATDVVNRVMSPITPYSQSTNSAYEEVKRLDRLAQAQAQAAAVHTEFNTTAEERVRLQKEKEDIQKQLESAYKKDFDRSTQAPFEERMLSNADAVAAHRQSFTNPALGYTPDEIRKLNHEMDIKVENFKQAEQREAARRPENFNRQTEISASQRIGGITSITTLSRNLKDEMMDAGSKLRLAENAAVFARNEFEANLTRAGSNYSPEEKAKRRHEYDIEERNRDLNTREEYQQNLVKDQIEAKDFTRDRYKSAISRRPEGQAYSKYFDSMMELKNTPGLTKEQSDQASEYSVLQYQLGMLDAKPPDQFKPFLGEMDVGTRADTELFNSYQYGNGNQNDSVARKEILDRMKAMEAIFLGILQNTIPKPPIQGTNT